MTNNTCRITKNIFALCFSLLMIAMSISSAFAAEAINPAQLSKNNVVEWPTTSGEMYFDQIIGDYITLVGGVVTSDGTAEGEVIPGKWEFIDPNATPIMASAKCPSSIKFVPTDDAAYTGFEVKNTTKTTFVVKEVAMEFSDLNAVPSVELKAGQKGTLLSHYTINGVEMKSSITGKTVAAKWNWVKSNTTVEGSGYYPATIKATGYTTIEMYVYLRVADDDSAPPISEFPTIETAVYHDGMKAKDLEIKGGKGNIAGHFEFGNPEQEIRAGRNAVTVVFIPDSVDQKQISITVLVEIEPAIASFVDENGEAYVPEIPLTLGTWNLGSLRIMLERLKANCGTFKIGDINIEGIELRNQLNSCDFSLENKKDGYAATAKLKSQENTSYTNTVQFKIVIEKKTVTPRITSYVDTDKLIIDGLSYTDKLAGTFKVYENGKLIESTKDGVKYLTTFKWRPEKSGTYTIKAEYTPSDDDICAIENNVIEQDVTVALKWTVNGENVNFASTMKKYGETVTVLQSLGDNFGGWEFYDENGNKYADPEKELGMEYNPNIPSTVTFVMPDHDVKVKAIDNTQAELPGGDSNLPDFFSKIINWINNLIAKLKGLFDAIKQLVSAVV